jgi:hypothetical protein
VRAVCIFPFTGNFQQNTRPGSFPDFPAQEYLPRHLDFLFSRKRLNVALSRYPELRTVFGKLESEEQGSRYAEFVSKVLKQPFHRFPQEPQLVHEILEEMRFADAVDILVFARDRKRSVAT